MPQHGRGQSRKRHFSSSLNCHCLDAVLSGKEKYTMVRQNSAHPLGRPTPADGRRWGDEGMSPQTHRSWNAANTRAFISSLNTVLPHAVIDRDFTDINDMKIFQINPSADRKLTCNYLMIELQNKSHKNSQTVSWKLQHVYRVVIAKATSVQMGNFKFYQLSQLRSVSHFNVNLMNNCLLLFHFKCIKTTPSNTKKYPCEIHTNI